MNIKKTSVASAFAITLGLSFVATPQVEAQGFLRYFGINNSSSDSGRKHDHSSQRYSHRGGHSQKLEVSKTLRKNVADLDRYSADLVAANSQRGRGHEYGRKGHSYGGHGYGGKGHGYGRSGSSLQWPLQNFSAKVDSLVWATKGGSPRAIKSAATDAQYAFNSVKSTAIRTHSSSGLKDLIKKTEPILSSLQREVTSMNSVTVTRTPVATNSHYNRRAYTPVPTSRFSWGSQTSTTTTTPTVSNNSGRNTSVATTTNNTDRNTNTTTANNDRTGDRGGNTNTRDTSGDRGQQGDRTGDRGSNTNTRDTSGDRGQQGDRTGDRGSNTNTRNTDGGRGDRTGDRGSR